MKRNGGTKQTNLSYIREWICTIGTASLYIVLNALWILSLLYGRHEIANKDVAELIWDSIFSVMSGAMAIADAIGTWLLIKYHPRCSKSTVITFAVITYILVIINNVGIKLPFSQATIVLINFSVLVALVCYILFIRPQGNMAEIPMDLNSSARMIHRAICGTENKKIIAVQMYKVVTKIKPIKDKEYVCYSVSSGDSFIRDGYDVNGVSSITYELERSIVDNFHINLLSYHNFLIYGKENTKINLIKSIDEEIKKLQLHLQSIERENRAVTKEDCCIARVLIIYLSFKRILTPNPLSQESFADYIGEVSLSDGDLDLKPSTENKLFTMVRTGVLGAALLGENSRHIFHYRKDSIKQGRKYCASTLRSIDRGNDSDFINQSMDICLFTIQDDKNAAIPGYVFRSIAKREEQILEALNKVKQGDGADD